MTKLLLSGGIAVVAMLIASQVIDRWEKSAQAVGASNERARVVTEEKKIDAKIKKAQRSAAQQPASSVLDKWSEP